MLRRVLYWGLENRYLPSQRSEAPSSLTLSSTSTESKEETISMLVEGGETQTLDSLGAGFKRAPSKCSKSLCWARVRISISPTLPNGTREDEVEEACVGTTT